MGGRIDAQVLWILLRFVDTTDRYKIITEWFIVVKQAGVAGCTQLLRQCDRGTLRKLRKPGSYEAATFPWTFEKVVGGGEVDQIRRPTTQSRRRCFNKGRAHGVWKSFASQISQTRHDSIYDSPFNIPPFQFSSATAIAIEKSSFSIISFNYLLGNLVQMRTQKLDKFLHLVSTRVKCTLRP